MNKIIDFDYYEYNDHIEIKKYLGNDIEVIVPSEIKRKSVTIIKEETFYDCNLLTSIIIPNNITIIGYEAFCNCNSLKSIIIPKSVTIIGGCAFKGCSSLKKIEIPSSVTTIYNGAFSGCYNIKIYGESGSYAENYAEENNIPFITQ